MTTNVFDGHAGLMASDSRWSNSDLGYAVLYVDDAEFEKIVRTEKLAFMFAGDAGKIKEWKEWAVDPAAMIRTMPDPDGVAMCMVDIKTGEIRREFDCDPDCMVEKARFAGTGAKHAYKCWTDNRDAKKAVSTAIGADRYSGGQVKFLELSTGENNLSKKDRYESIVELFKSKGKYMFIQPQGKLGEELDVDTGDEAVKALAHKVASGEARLEAPTSSRRVWSPEEKEELKRVLSEYYPQ